MVVQARWGDRGDPWQGIPGVRGAGRTLGALRSPGDKVALWETGKGGGWVG